MPTSSELTESARSSQEKGSIPTLAIEDATRVWRVHAGRVDLFFQKMAGGRYGARSLVASFHPGQAIFGIDLQQHGGVAIVALPHPGTVVTQTSRAVFCRQGTLSTEQSPMHLAEIWAHALMRACTQRQTAAASATGSTVGLSPQGPGTVENTAAEPLSIVPEQRLLWALPVGGQVRFLGLTLIASGAIFPLIRASEVSLQLGQGAQVELLDPLAAERLDWQLRWLDSFHTVVFRTLIAIREAEETDWLGHLEREREADRWLTHHALKNLAMPLAGSGQAAEPKGFQSDPFLAAAKALESELGVVFEPLSSAGKTLSFRHAVEALAAAASVRHRRVALRGTWWRFEAGSMLAILRDAPTPIALAFRSAGSYEAFDPVACEWRRVDAEYAASLQPIAYQLYRRLPLRPLKSLEVVRLMLEASGADLSRTLLMGLCSGLMALAFPMAMGWIFDDVIPHSEHSGLIAITAFLGVVALANAAFALVRNLAVLRAEARVDTVAQAAVWDRLMRLPVPFFRRFTTGDLAVRSLAVNQIRLILTNATLSAVLSGVFSLTSLALLFLYSPPVGLLAVALTAAFLAVNIAASLLQLRFTRRVSRMRGKISATLLELINGVAKLRVSATEDRAFGIWARLFSEQKNYYMRARRIASSLYTARSLYPLIALIPLFLALADPHRTGPAMGNLLVVFTAYAQFAASIVQLTAAFPSIIAIVPVFERMQPILAAAPEVAEGRPAPSQLRGGIEIGHVTFRYDPDSPAVVRDLSLEIKPGEFVAFTGPSGSGKSSLLRLLLGFETPESGTISYDSQDIRGIDIQALRRQIGVVLQSGRLVSGSILDNILGSLPLTHDDAWEAARLAGLDADIKAMPMGMHTFVNDGGTGLSGGQRQRLMIARAIVSRPRILLFDEATSALDNRTQAVVARSLEQLRATRVVIAHRLSTIQNADRIFVFDRGRIVQTGTFDQLTRVEGLFQTLVKRQVA